MCFLNSVLMERSLYYRTKLSLYQRLESADLTFNDISMSLGLMKHCSIRLSQKVDNRLKGPPRPAMGREMDIPTEENGPLNSNTNSKQSSAIYYNAHSGPLPIPNNFFPTIPRSSIDLERVSPIFPTVSNSTTLFQHSSAIISRSLGQYCPGVQVQETILTPPYLRVVNYRSCFC